MFSVIFYAYFKYFIDFFFSFSCHTTLTWCHYCENCRPSFKSLQQMMFDIPTVALMALTATAPPDILQKLEQCLGNPLILKASIDRQNISFQAKRSKFGGQLPISVANGKSSAGKVSVTIVYCNKNHMHVRTTVYNFDFV